MYKFVIITNLTTDKILILTSYSINNSWNVVLPFIVIHAENQTSKYIGSYPEHKKLEGHDHEWFYSPTYANAKIIAELLSEGLNLGHPNCQYCKPSS